MAKRRMFSLDVVDTDTFLDLPASSQSLYFHLGMRADDDGFVSSPKRITAMVNASGDDLKLLMAKGFVIPFDSGVCVIRDWKVNNYIQSDRYTPTLYMEERKHLSCKKSGQYDYSDTPCIQSVSELDTQVRLGKDRKAKSKSVKADKPLRASPRPPLMKSNLTAQSGKTMLIQHGSLTSTLQKVGSLENRKCAIGGRLCGRGSGQIHSRRRRAKTGFAATTQTNPLCEGATI